MSNNMTVTTLEVRKNKWSETRIVREPLATELAEDEVLPRVDRFAVEAVERTYQAVLAGRTDVASGQIVSLWAATWHTFSCAVFPIKRSWRYYWSI